VFPQPDKWKWFLYFTWTKCKNAKSIIIIIIIQWTLYLDTSPKRLQRLKTSLQRENDFSTSLGENPGVKIQNLIYRFSQAEKRSRQGINCCSFLKNSPETFRSEIYFGAFSGSFAFEKCFSKSPKVFRIVLQYFGDLFCKTKLKRSFYRLSIAWFFFSGIKLNTYFTQEPSCLVFAMFPYPVINCHGLSNLLGLLAVRLNELQTAFIYNNKI